MSPNNQFCALIFATQNMSGTESQRQPQADGLPHRTWSKERRRSGLKALYSDHKVEQIFLAILLYAVPTFPNTPTSDNINICHWATGFQDGDYGAFKASQVFVSLKSQLFPAQIRKWQLIEEINTIPLIYWYIYPMTHTDSSYSNVTRIAMYICSSFPPGSWFPTTIWWYISWIRGITYNPWSICSNYWIQWRARICNTMELLGTGRRNDILNWLSRTAILL